MFFKFFIIVGILLIIVLLSTRFQRIVMHNMSILKYFLFIGIFLHELSHAIACALTGAKIHKFHLDFYYGYVEHEESKFPILGPILISLAPMIFGTFYIYLLLFVFAEIDLLKILFINEFGNIIFRPDHLSQFLKILDLTKYYNWILLYLLINLTVSFIPSKDDFKNIYISVIIYAFIIMLLQIFNNKMYDIYLLLDKFHSYIIFIFLLALIIQLFFYVLVWTITRLNLIKR